MRYDTLIIGAGMSGLAAGIRLAYYDRKVLICERHGVPGGLNSYFSRKKRIFDVGLHALTNYGDRKERSAPLNRLLRQLKIKRDELGLVPQYRSAIRFPDSILFFNNDINLLVEEVSKEFPDEVDGFNLLIKDVRSFDALSLESKTFLSTREKLKEFIGNPLLIEMILCPLMYYGSSWEEDIDYPQFVILFQSILLEGFARPDIGVIKIIRLLKKKYRENGGLLKMRCGVCHIIVKDSKAVGVALDSGEEILADKIISSAGLCETDKIVEGDLLDEMPAPGTLSFTEVMLLLDDPISGAGYDNTIMFYNDHEKFDYRSSEDFVDTRSGVICSPDNYLYEDESRRPEPMLRVTNLANHRLWEACDPDTYVKRKELWLERILDKVGTLVPLNREKINYTDMFTPTTITKFTGRFNGAVYGAPVKVRDGRTNIENLFICGTDQGFLGIVGAMLSGVSIANLHCLKG